MDNLVFAKSFDKIVLRGDDMAPNFELVTDDGGKITLQQLKGKKVVLYFYPRDDTPGCTVEAKDFAAAMPEFEKLNTVIIGVSKDSVESHTKFKGKYCLPFTLGSDQDSKVCENYGVWVEKNNYGKKYMGIERTTFLINENGQIKEIWSRVKVDGHVAEVLEAVKGLK